MRDQVLKQRSECKRTFVKKGDYPDEFIEKWRERRVSDYSSRKAAAFGMWRTMDKEIQSLKAQNKKLKREINRYWIDVEYLEKIKSQNKKLRECVEFYGGKAFDIELAPLQTIVETDMLMSGYLFGVVIPSDREWCGKNQLGGKKARECLKGLE